jgi:hypothetical protein
MMPEFPYLPPGTIFAMASSRDRMRALRARQRAGEQVLRLSIDEIAAAEWLIATGRISEAAALDPDEVASAISRFIRESITRSK